MRSSSLRCSVLVLGYALAAGSGCTRSQQPGAATSTSPIQRGKSVYQSSCTSCHNPDPRLPGALGPEIAKAPRELVEARVMRAEYPAGYKPKRASKLMTPLPQLKDEISALTDYLNSL